MSLGGKALPDGYGKMPLPPYIHARLEDDERYQTVYSRPEGSAAAPTAGLHFTPGLLDGLKLKGVNTAFVTLHVGLDTFQPVRAEDPSRHHIHTEYGRVGRDTADLINDDPRPRHARGGCGHDLGAADGGRFTGRPGRALRGTGGAFHPAGLPVPGHRCHGHQLPSAQIHPADDGVGLRRARVHTGLLRNGQTGRLYDFSASATPC